VRSMEILKVKISMDIYLSIFDCLLDFKLHYFLEMGYLYVWVWGIVCLSDGREENSINLWAVLEAKCL